MRKSTLTSILAGIFLLSSGCATTETLLRVGDSYKGHEIRTIYKQNITGKNFYTVTFRGKADRYKEITADIGDDGNGEAVFEDGEKAKVRYVEPDMFSSKPGIIMSER